VKKKPGQKNDGKQESKTSPEKVGSHEDEDRVEDVEANVAFAVY